MSDIIHLLPDHIANQIAAGEVIQRPASVVKELMENSVDAGAKTITVNIKDAGRTLVQVADDGKGMSETDARMAFERHATSKIASVEDLFSLQSMGFRGEALASIAAVAQVDLHTKMRENETGIFLSIAGSVLTSVSPEVCHDGSIFSIKNLFYNVPARRKFLKTNDVEFRHILAEFERIALVHPHISFTLRHNETVILTLPAGGLKQRIIAIFGKSMNEKLLPVEANTSLVNVSGFTAQPGAAKKSGHRQYFFVNGRYMRHPYFHKAVMQAYEQMIPAGEMPDYFIYFTLDPSSIDVNIHPTKTEVKFEHEKPVWQIICSAIRESLAKANAVPSIDFEAAGIIDIPVYDPSQKPVESPTLHVNKDYNPFHQPMDWKSLYEGFEKNRASATLPNHHLQSDIPANQTKQSPVSTGSDMLSPVPTDSDILSNLPPAGSDIREDALFTEFQRPCFQYKNRYIITPLKSGLVIIDQHRAHVRILYERYIKNITRRSSVSQKLLFPEMVDLTVAESLLLTSLGDEIRLLGFDLAHLGGNSYAIHATPVELSGGNPAIHFKNIITAAIESGISEKEKLTEKMALSLAKTAAIHVGKVLSIDEMEALVANLFALDTNGITPDGQPTLTILTDEELSDRL